MLKALFIFLIRFYQVMLSPFLGGRCRFEPSCSVYAEECISRFGAGRGGVLAVKRLLRCHPFGGFGFDPPPKIELDKMKEK